jgi:hypothetical protein
MGITKQEIKEQVERGKDRVIYSLKRNSEELNLAINELYKIKNERELLLRALDIIEEKKRWGK